MESSDRGLAVQRGVWHLGGMSDGNDIGPRKTAGFRRLTARLLPNSKAKNGVPVWRGVARRVWAAIWQGSASARRGRARIMGRGPGLRGSGQIFLGSPAGFAGGPAGFGSSRQKIPGSGGLRASSRGRRVGSRAGFHVFRGVAWFSGGKAAMPVSGPPSPRPHCR